MKTNDYARSYRASDAANKGGREEKEEQGDNSKNAGNQIKGSQTFTEAEVQAAQAHFTGLSDKDKEEYLDQSVVEDMLSLNALKIKRLYPNSFKLCVEYISEKSRLPQTDDVLIGIFLYGPRTILYEFFDDAGLYINVVGASNQWHYTITSETIQVVNGGIAKTRREAEKLALEEAFSHLDKI